MSKTVYPVAQSATQSGPIAPEQVRVMVQSEIDSGMLIVTGATLQYFASPVVDESGQTISTGMRITSVRLQPRRRWKQES